MAKVYISCHHPDPANELAAVLTAAGHTVVSDWHTDPSPRPAKDDAAGWGENATRNLTAITKADALVVVASPGHLDGTARVPGGKFVEAGFALGYVPPTGLSYEDGNPPVSVFTLGGVENGMLYHPAVRHAKDAAELLAMLAASS